MNKIFLDMDGVLADFDHGLEQFNVKNDCSFLHKPKSEWTPLQKKLDRQVIDCMNHDGFFFNLPGMKGFKDLWVAAHDLGEVYVLTAWPKTAVDVSRVAREKSAWIEQHFGGIGDHFICCAREDKAKYAEFGHILVDDLQPNIDKWEEHNGTGILFTSADQAIKELNELF